MKITVPRFIIEIPNVPPPDPAQLAEAITQTQPAKVEVTIHFLKNLVAVATNTWRSKSRLADPMTGEPREENKRVFRHIEAIERSLAEMGFEIKDHTNDTYDQGQALKVVATETQIGISRPRVKETLLPTIFFESRIVQHGEVVVAVPNTEGQLPQSELAAPEDVRVDVEQKAPTETEPAVTTKPSAETESEKLKEINE